MTVEVERGSVPQITNGERGAASKLNLANIALARMDIVAQILEGLYRGIACVQSTQTC